MDIHIHGKPGNTSDRLINSDWRLCPATWTSRLYKIRRGVRHVNVGLTDSMAVDCPIYYVASVGDRSSQSTTFTTFQRQMYHARGKLSTQIRRIELVNSGLADWLGIISTSDGYIPAC